MDCTVLVCPNDFFQKDSVVNLLSLVALYISERERLMYESQLKKKLFHQLRETDAFSHLFISLMFEVNEVTDRTLCGHFKQ